MTAELTVIDVAARVAQANDQGDSGADYWIRLFRNLHTAMLLPAQDYRGQGRTAAALYDRTGLCLAGVTAALLRRFRMEPAAVRDVLASLQNPGNFGPRIKFAEAVDAVARGEEWSLTIIVIAEGPATRFVARVHPSDQAQPAPSRADRVYALKGLQTVGQIAVDLVPVLSPYLKAD